MGILPTRRELHDRIKNLEARIRDLETPAEAAKILIAALEDMDLPDTARAIQEIFVLGDKP